MELSITTDFVQGTGDPTPYLKKISKAGFKHIQWIHHWGDDFIYTKSEIEYIAGLIKELDLSIYDIHASAGLEKHYFSPIEYQRLAGVDIVKNRVKMCRKLGGSDIVMHIPPHSHEHDSEWSQLKKSLHELEGYCKDKSIKIAVENNDPVDDFTGIKELLSEFDSNFIGLCYDSGHGNIDGHGLDYLDSVKDRLISIHLNDNDGNSDQHKPLFTGTVDWKKLARIISQSPYNKPLTFETNIRFSGTKNEDEFLKQAYADGIKFSKMLESDRTV
jgi:sugar phosphate isomerase/epimerase